MRRAGILLVCAVLGVFLLGLGCRTRGCGLVRLLCAFPRRLWVGWRRLFGGVGGWLGSFWGSWDWDGVIVRIGMRGMEMGMGMGMGYMVGWVPDRVCGLVVTGRGSSEE